MPQRFLRPGITNSELWNAVSFPAQSLFVRLLTLVDDFGRYDARPVLVRSHAFPVSPEMTVDKVEGMLDELSSAGIIILYSSGGKDFLQVCRWQERARTASRFPDPPGEDTDSQRRGLIYFVQGVKTKRIKIGFTNWRIENRLTALQTSSSEKLELLGTMPGTTKQERELHKRFEPQRESGEWFAPSDELLALANSCKHLPAKENICAPPSPSSLAIDHRPSPSPAAPVGADPEAVVSAWNETSLPKVATMTAARKAALKARLSEPFFRDNWQQAMAKISASDFCRGATDRGDWKATFDWFVTPDAAVKVMEGKYDNGAKTKPDSKTFPLTTPGPKGWRPPGT